MKRLILHFIALWVCASMYAQRITVSFQDTPLPEVLEQLTLMQDEYQICAINNDLENFVITANIADATIPEALGQITAYYPIRCIVNENIIHVEALRKQLIQYRGTVMGQDSTLLSYATVSLFHAADTTLIQHAACSNAGVFVVPCEEQNILMRITHVAHDTLWVKPTTDDLGTLVLHERNVKLDTAKVVAPPWTGRNVTLSFQFIDSFTSLDIPKEKKENVSLYVEDDAKKTFPFNLLIRNNGMSKKTYYRFEIPARPGDYMLEVHYAGYEPLLLPYHVGKTGRRQVIDTEPIRLHRQTQKMQTEYIEDPDGDIIIEGKRMREVVVQATRVQMYYKGDTIVYNADAFTLPDGSMLDDLLKAMPGVEINNHGEIKVNGRKVDVLQLDGKDLLNGGTEMLLQNLPHYTVEQIKVFEQDQLEARIVGAKSVEKEYTLNVTLKKQYKIGWLGNFEIAGGLPTGRHEDLRYQARAFVTRFSEQSRLMASGMSNNINNDASNSSESWSDYIGRTGLQRRNYLSLMYNVYDRRQRYEENILLQTKWTHSESEKRQSSLTYLTQGDTYARNYQTSKNKDFACEFGNTFILKKPFALTLRTYINYDHRESNGLSQSAQFNEDPSSYGDVVAVIDTLMQNPFNSRVSDITLNKTLSQSKQNGSEWRFAQHAQYSKKFNSGDYFSINPVFTHTRQTGIEHNNYQLNYLQGTGLDDFRHRYNLSPAHSNRFDTYTKYTYNVNSELSFVFGADLIWEQTHTEHERYRFEKLDGWSAEQALDALPSTRELMLKSFDSQNSYIEDYSEFLTKTYINMNFSKKRDNHRNELYLRLPVIWDFMREKYQRGTLDTCFSRKYVMPRVDVSYTNSSWKKTESGNNIERSNTLQYWLSGDHPDMQMLLNVRDAYNPQTITLGNPNLRRSFDHNVYSSFRYSRFKSRGNDGIYEDLSVRFHTRHNAIATGYTYNPATGVYTYQPTNINGNWDGNLNWRHRHALSKLIAYEVNNDYTYRHSVDLIGGERSTVNSQSVKPSLQLMCKPDSKNQITLTGTWNWTRYDSERPGFTTRSTLNHQYVLNAQLQLPGDIQFVTDFGLYMRSGYDTPSMNTSDWVWNASFSRSFMKNNLLLKVTGYDILQQINSITQDYNSQGRTETWVRSIPSYVMATLTYKFHVAPKSK